MRQNYLSTLILDPEQKRWPQRMTLQNYKSKVLYHQNKIIINLKLQLFAILNELQVKKLEDLRWWGLQSV